MEDAQRIAPLLREKDKREIEVVSGLNPEASLPRAFDLPGERIIAETSNGDPILIGGAHPTHPKVAAAIWMLGTPLLEHYALPSVRTALRYIERWHQTYPLLWNRALEANDLHVRWLKLLGFSFIRRVDIRGFPFIEFVRIKPSPCVNPSQPALPSE